MDRHWFKEALFAGMTSNAFKLGTALTLGWFWSRVAGCLALYRGLGMESVDFSNILAVTELNADVISPPGYLPHENGCTYFYVVRRVNSCGYQELTLSAAVKVCLDGDGELAKPQPNKIFAWDAKQIEGNKIQLIWYYCPIEQESKPVRFNVYFDSGTGQIDYEEPVATIAYKGRKFYNYTSGVLQAGRYLFAIRAEDINGTDDSSFAVIKVQLNGVNPDAIEVLSVEVV